ncbi:MAG: XRE family transcriptional regulator [Paludibacteraceae bacterium]|nr:XRE family transcriptional regulator [Paludibacteraceae bacterium]
MNEEIHIGKIIKAELDKQGRKHCWLAKEIHCEPSNINKILNRKSIDCELLLEISKALQINLFEFYEKAVNNR